MSLEVVTDKHGTQVLWSDTRDVLTCTPAYLGNASKLLLPGNDYNNRLRVLFLRDDAAPEMKILTSTWKSLLHKLGIATDSYFAEIKRRIIKGTDVEDFRGVSITTNGDA